MKILHVLSTNFYSGSLSYTLSLVNKQVENHHVIIATDHIFESPDYTSYQLPISNRKYAKRFSNIRALRSIIKNEGVTVVHAHSRAASWLVNYAVKGLKVAVVSSVHGAQVKHSRFKNQDIYGNKIIAICDNLSDQLINEIGIDASKIKCIPNGIDDALIQQQLAQTSSDSAFVISIIGRFNGVKGEHISVLINQVLPVLLGKNPHIIIQLIGPEWQSTSEATKKSFDELKTMYPKQLIRMDYQKDIYSIMQASTLIIGSGRVAIESLLMKKPVFSIGEVVMNGFITEENIQTAMANNFGDIEIGKKSFTLDVYVICTELQRFIDMPVNPSQKVSNFLNKYKISAVVNEIESVYKEAISQQLTSKPFPILMYHKVPDADINSPHKIFVSKDKFRKQLRFFKWRGFTSITFKDYLAYSDGTIHAKHFPKKPLIISFDDGYLSSFENALPLCQKYNFKGVLFLLGDFGLTHNNWDKAEQYEPHNLLMNNDHKKAFVAAGWEIGAHTMTHPNLTEQTALEIEHELISSKNNLEKELNIDVISFAYPFGYYNDRVKDLVKSAGFSYGIATDTGGIHIEDDRFAIFRVNIFPKESYFSLYKKTSNWYRLYYKRKRGK
jgi:peptidoglycan/xylan/chitin deacetylase (PgdA/CDA1 family)/UDP-N-acetylglucosamine:LPS N-acetylglucosamine transferase